MQGLYLTYQRIGQGTNIATVGTSGAVFYINGTGSSSEITTDIPGVYPMTLDVQGQADFDFTYPEGHNVGVNVNGGTTGLTLAPALTGPAAGTFLACDRNSTFPSGPSELQQPRYLYDGEDLPSGCAEVNLTLECASFAELPPDSTWNHDAAQHVSCS